jgi:hypothetical protein
LLLRDSKTFKIVVDNELKQKKTNDKKQRANKISSLNTMNSKKHNTENKKILITKYKSNIKKI